MTLLARLIVQAEGHGAILLRRGPYTIGRSVASDLYLVHRTVSRQHATIDIDATRTLTLHDHGSRNGTFVNGVPVQTLQLAPQSTTIVFGSVVCALEWFKPREVDDIAQATDTGESTPAEQSLTAAEERVFTLLMGGFDEKKIATKLCISRHTVHTHVKRIYKVYGIHTRAELLATCLRSQARV